MKQLFYIKAEDATEQVIKSLSMRIGDKHFSFAITGQAGAVLYSLAYYTADEITGDVLSEIFSQHEDLHISFANVQVSYDYAGSVLVPRTYHNNGEGAVLLDTIYGKQVHCAIISEPVNGGEIFNVYAVPEDVHEWVSRVFLTFQHRHSYTIAASLAPDDAGDCLLIDFDKDEFSFIATRQRQLLIAQTLPYSNPEDILYYLLKTCNQFSLSREEVKLSVSGLIEKESQLYRELYQYFLNTDFREPGWEFPGEAASIYPGHFFTSLNDLARCES